MGPLFQIWKKQYAAKIYNSVQPQNTLKVIPLDCTRQEDGNAWKNMLKIIFRNEKDDEMDLEVNTVCHSNGPAPPLGTPTNGVFWIFDIRFDQQTGW